ncbi:MAG TPA: hypothetical protein VLJ14_14430 [Ktedonobacterales bacterium]|jgi:hypothetical protein|nr:hypothetical protein [Ktedonobacterales bacterium]
MDSLRPEETPVIIGSAEPLSSDETERRLRELAAWVVDLTLVRAALARTPTERINRMLDLLALSEALGAGYARTRTGTMRARRDGAAGGPKLTAATPSRRSCR